MVKFTITFLTAALAAVAMATPAPVPTPAGVQVEGRAPVSPEPDWDKQPGYCGKKKAGWCDQNGCSGRAEPSTWWGVCEGNYKDCFCRNVCDGKTNSCKKNGCEGSNGRCQSGKYKGCYCTDS